MKRDEERQSSFRSYSKSKRRWVSVPPKFILTRRMRTKFQDDFFFYSRQGCVWWVVPGKSSGAVDLQVTLYSLSSQGWWFILYVCWLELVVVSISCLAQQSMLQLWVLKKFDYLCSPNRWLFPRHIQSQTSHHRGNPLLWSLCYTLVDHLQLRWHIMLFSFPLVCCKGFFYV